MTGPQPPFDSSPNLQQQLDLDFALGAAGIGIWEVDPLTNQVRWDARCGQLFGLHTTPTSYPESLRHIHPDDVERVNQAVQWAMNPQSDGSYQATYRSLGQDGRTRWIRATGRSYFDPAGQPLRLAGIAQEVTGQVEAQQQAQRQRRIYEAITTSTPDLMYVFDLNYKFTYANRALLAMWGRSEKESIGKGLLENGYEPWHAQLHEREIDQVIATKQLIRGEVSFVHATLGRRLYDYVFAPVLNEQGEVEFVAGTTRDITEIKQAQALLQESEARFRRIIEQTPTPTLVLRGDDYVVDQINAPMLALMGQGPAVIGQPLLTLMPELDQELAWQQVQRVYQEGIDYDGQEVFVTHSTGELVSGRYYNLAYRPLREGGQITGMIQVVHEVTQQVLARQQLEDLQVHLQEAIELAQLGIWSIDVATNELSFSDRLIEWFGYDPDDQDYQQVIPILDAADQARVTQAVAWALNPQSDGVYDEIYTVIHPQTGQKRILHARGKTVFDAHGQALRLNGTAQDITLQREMQLALEQQVQQQTEAISAANEELAATNEEITSQNEALNESTQQLLRSNDNLQRFAYVASHDLQEPLRKIRQFGDLLREHYGPQLGEGLTYLERMQSAAGRMSTLIKDLLEYSRLSTQPESSAPVSLAEVVNQVLGTLELAITETRAEVQVASLPTIHGDALQLSQLFQNLLANALKFHRPGVPPVIRIRARWLAAEHLPAGVNPLRNAIAYHQIEVADNGIGFEEKYLDRIFNVFQRLHGKNQYAGTGIGLAICEKVVTNHGGAITASSQPGQGATFRVYLPV